MDFQRAGTFDANGRPVPAGGRHTASANADLPYKVEVQADGPTSDAWAGNALRFATREEAERYARDLAARWTAVRDWRVADAS